MHIQTHILSGWCVANCIPTTSRQRVAAMIAASACDVDGVSYLFGQKAYWDYHHTFGHNLFFGIVLSAVLALWARPRCVTFFLCVALVHLHLYMDYWGSGPDWHIHYLWPMKTPVWRNAGAWDFFSWQNITVFFLLLGWTGFIARTCLRTPLEWLMPRLDHDLVRLVAGRRVPAVVAPLSPRQVDSPD